jgi:flavin reductase (DIM6/NTAB) family NADH-FMN oxidoreductase RutF
MTHMAHLENYTEQTFDVTAENKRAFRNALGQFATGVTIVTVASDDGPVGIVANSFASVSMDPPLVLWSPDRGSRRYPYFANAQHYAIHVLSADQADLCQTVAKDMHALQALDIAVNSEGVPLFSGALARFECVRHAVYDGGDHDIVVGRVLRAAMRDQGQALAFFQGRMTSLAV